MRRGIFAAALLTSSTVAVFALVTTANSLALFATDSACDCLYIVDLVSGDTTYIGELGSPGQFETPTSMAVDLDGTLYTVNNSTGELLTIDKSTGSATIVATGVGQQDGLAIAPVSVQGPGDTTFPEGTLFGSTFDLVVIDKGTGDVTAIGPIGRRIGGLAFRSDGTLFGAELSSGTDTLVTISTVDGAGTIIGELGPDLDRIGALVFTSGDTLLGSDINNVDRKIFEVDQTTAGISNEIATAASPQGMGFASAVQCTTFDDLDQTIADAEINNKGIRNSVQVKANNARKQYDKGKLKTSGNVLCALIHHVDAQDGKHITSASADDIRNCVITLAEHLEIPLKCLDGDSLDMTLPRNYPNPFRSAATIEYEIGDSGLSSQILSADGAQRVVLRIYDLTGREVRTLIDAEQEPGYYVIEWNGRSGSGETLPNGIYFYHLSIGGTTSSRKMVLMK